MARNSSDPQEEIQEPVQVIGGEEPWFGQWLTARQKARITAEGPLPAARANTPQDEWVQGTFIEALAITGSAVRAAEAADISRAAIYAERKRNLAFAERWDEALERFAAWVEGEVVHRATVGRQRPVFYLGRLVALVHEPSDNMLLALARKTSAEWRAALASGSGTTVNVNATAVAGATAALGEDLAGKLGRLSPEKRAALRLLLDAHEALPPPDASANASSPVAGKPGASGRELAPIDVQGVETPAPKPGSRR